MVATATATETETIDFQATNTPDTPTDTFTPTYTPSPVPVAYVSQSVDHTQDTLVAVGDGMTVDIPAGSLTQDITMTIFKYAAGNIPAGQAFQVEFMGYVYFIDTGGVEPQASASVTITLPYDPASVPNGTLETDLTISYFDGTSWVTLPATVDTVNHTVTVVTNHFSLWAVTIKKSKVVQIVTKPVLFPNPASGSQVKLILPAGMDMKIALYTTSYRKVREIKVGQTASGTILTLDLSDNAGTVLANGVYYVAVTTLNSRWTLKLLILK